MSTLGRSMRRGLIACLFILHSIPLFCVPLDPEMESAYRNCFAHDLGYTLIGEKPISAEDLQDTYLHVPPQIHEKFVISLKTLFKGSSKYIFKAFEFDSSSGKRSYEIELIHRQALRDLVAKSASLKGFIQEHFPDEEEFFLRIENPDISVFRVINNECIMGILFGYGEENAVHYSRMTKLGFYLKKYPLIRLIDPYINMLTCLSRPDIPRRITLPYAIKAPELGEGFDSLEAEWAWLQKIDWNMMEMASESEAVPPYFVHLPFYRCRKEGQSDALRAKYMRARSKLAYILSRTSYQKAVAEVICSQ